MDGKTEEEKAARRAEITFLSAESATVQDRLGESMEEISRIEKEISDKSAQIKALASTQTD